MKKLIPIAIISLALSGCTIPFIGKKQAALQVNASPQSNVFLNDSHVGQTPYFDDKLKPGEYNVKIQNATDSSQEWQTSVTLSPKIITVIDRQFGSTSDESSNHLLQLEALAQKDATEISIITIPDNVIVKLDNQPEGFSPVSLKDVGEGDHTIVLTAPGHQEKTIKAQIKAGFKLIISAQLARTSGIMLQNEQDASPSAQLEEDEEIDTEEDEKLTPTKKPIPKPTKKTTSSTATSSANLERPYVTITETGTGWLRVRSAPNASVDNEVAKIDVGESFSYIESNDTGWYKIEFSEGEEGWISGKYAELYK